MLKGTYIFYEDGKEIYRSSNLITKFGKRFLANFIAGNASFANKNIAVGIANQSEYAISDTNSRLGFEFFRTPVDFGSTNIQSNAGVYTYYVIYKATLPQNMAGIINEIGLYPQGRATINMYDDKFISDFENNLLWADSNGNYPDLVNETLGGTLPRVGSYLIKVVTAGSSSTKEYFANINSFDLSGYSVNDSMSIALNADSKLAGVKVRFYSSDVDYYEMNFGAPSATGNIIIEKTLSDMFLNPAGTPNSAAINKISIEILSSSAGSTTAYIDGLRINDEDTFDPAYGLISRSILATPLEKKLGRQVDVEYRLELF